MGLQGLVRPAVAGVLAPDHHALAREAQGPDLGRMDVGDARLHDVGRFVRRALWLRQDIADRRIALDPRHVGPRRQRQDQGAIALHPERVDDVEGLVLHAARAQLRQQRSLRGLRGVPERVAYEPALGQLRRQRPRGAQVGLLGQHHDELRGAAGGGLLHDPGRDLVLGACGQGRGDGSRQQGARQDGQDGSVCVSHRGGVYLRAEKTKPTNSAASPRR